MLMLYSREPIRSKIVCETVMFFKLLVTRAHWQFHWLLFPSFCFHEQEISLFPIQLWFLQINIWLWASSALWECPPIWPHLTSLRVGCIDPGLFMSTEEKRLRLGMHVKTEFVLWCFVWGRVPDGPPKKPFDRRFQDWKINDQTWNFLLYGRMQTFLIWLCFTCPFKFLCVDRTLCRWVSPEFCSSIAFSVVRFSERSHWQDIQLQ